MVQANRTSKFPRIVPWALGAVFLVGIWGIASNDRSEFGVLFLWFTLVFGTYVLILRNAKAQMLTFGLILAFLARILFFPYLPQLSDDYVRFFWDGSLVVSGMSPYELAPETILQTGETSRILLEIFPMLNSPSYYSVYPPLMQGIFALAVKLGGTLVGMVTVLRLLLMLAEGVTIAILIYGLRSFGKDPGMVLLYALNPLVIAEVAGNLHFEGFVVPFLLFGLLAATQFKPVRAGTGLALAGAIKLVPFLFIPFLLKHLSPPKRIFFLIAVFVLAGMGILLPLMQLDGFSGMTESLALYFRHFEFNASVYYIARWAGEFLVGYNPIAVTGPVLSITAIVLIMFLLLFYRTTTPANLVRVCLVALTIYLFLSTTVHPWYLIPLIALAPLSGFVYPFVWSYLCVLSYASYSVPGVRESVGFLILEYGIVFAVFAWEAWNLRGALKSKRASTES